MLIAVLGLLFFADLLLHPTQVLYSDHSDLLAMHLPTKRFLVRSWQETGEVPLWCPYSFAGMPLVHDVQVAAFYPPHLPLYLLPEEYVGVGLSWLVVLHVVAAGWCMFAYARGQGLGQPGSLVAALGFMFAGKWLLHVLAGGHYVMVPLAWLPLVLLGLDRAVRRGSLPWATGAGAAFALIVLGTHPQMTFYAGLFAALWGLGPVLERAGFFGDKSARSWRRTVAALAWWLGAGAWAAAVAVALSAVQLLPALEAVPEASRGGGLAASAGWDVTRLAVLSLVGGAWTGQSWEWQGGLGVLWVALAVLAPCLCRGRVRFQAAAGLVVLLFAVGGGSLVQGLPGFRLFQVPMRMAMLLAVPVALLAGAATDALIARPAAGRRARAVLLLTAAVAVAFTGCLASLLRREGLPLVVNGYWLSLFVTVPLAWWLLRPLYLSGAGGGVGWAESARPTDSTPVGLADSAHPTVILRLARPGWQLAWAAVLVADLWSLAWPLVAVRPQEEVYATSAGVRFLADKRRESEPERWRVLDRAAPAPSDTPLGAALPMLGPVRVEPVLGYNSFDVRRHKEYLQFVAGSDAPLRPREGSFGFAVVGRFPLVNKPLLDLLGTRYLVQPADEEVPAGWRPAADDPHPAAYSFLAGGVKRDLPAFRVCENPDALPRAFVVTAAAPLPGDEVLSALKTTDFRRVVLLEGVTAENVGACPGKECLRAAIRAYRPNRVAVELPAGADGYLVLTDIWYPGWTCTVDGVPAEVYRADYLFRAVRVPAGAREAVFTFDPASYRRGKAVSGAAVVALAVLCAVTTFARRRQRSEPPA